MRKQGMESGRSMLEMVAVLVIILLLTLGGLTGYNYLVQRFRRQESVKEVAELVMSVKTAELTRKHDAGATIAAREIVQGPKMDGKGEVIKLPEGENSFAVVTNLTGGAFAVNLQVEKGTCQALLETLKNEDITMFLPSDKTLTDRTIAQDAKAWAEGSRVQEIMGVKYNVEETEEDKKLMDSEKGAKLRSQIMAACAGDDGLGRAALVFDCAKGSSSYGYLYDLFCSGCPVGTMRDTNGTCCSYTSANRCGNLCSCPKGTMCDTNKNKCVECAAIPNKSVGNAACKNKYNEFKRHVCNDSTNRCVECTDESDCKNTSGFKDSEDYLPSYEYCYDHKCVNCNMNYDGTPIGVGHYPCQDVNEPLCSNGICTTCPEGKIWNDAAAVCTTCYDSAAGLVADKGCEADRTTPICLTEPVVRNDGTKGNGRTCVQCTQDDHCPTDTPVCDMTTYMCETCAAKDPNKPVWDDKSKTCVNCKDSEAGVTTDAGCNQPRWAGNPICLTNPPKNEKSQLVGDSCVECLTDENCPGESPVCSEDHKCETCADKDPNKPVWNSATKTCEVCKDTEAGSTVDAGCDAARWAGKPVCLTNPVKNEKSGLVGGSCVECVADADCPTDKPACDTTTHTCKTCTGTTPVWDNASQKCVVCKDTASKSGQDAGCGSGLWNGKDICDAHKNDGNGTVGGACGSCIDDYGYAENKVDTGCEGTGKEVCVGENKSAWKDSKSMDVGTRCIECTTSDYCTRKYANNAKPVCNQSTFSCEACPSGKYWDTSKKACLECNGHYMSKATHPCGSAKPVCDNQGANATFTCKPCATGLVWNSSAQKCVQCNVDADCKTGDNKWCENNVCVPCNKTVKVVGLTEFATRNHFWHNDVRDNNTNYEWKIQHEGGRKYTCRHNLDFKEWHVYSRFEVPADGWIWMGVAHNYNDVVNSKRTANKVYKNWYPHRINGKMDYDDRVWCGGAYYEYNPPRCAP